MRALLRPLVVIPTFNERDNIRQLIPAILDADGRLSVLVVDDASPDGTAQAVLEAKRSCPPDRVHLQVRFGKLGFASATVHGLKWGLDHGYDFLIQMDGDWSHDPSYLPQMLHAAGKADFVIGSRYIDRGGTSNWHLSRHALSMAGNTYSRLVLGNGLADYTGGFNGWFRDTLRAIRLDSIRSRGYSFQIEMKYRARRLGYTPVEIPIIFRERRAGKSKMSAFILFEAAARVLQLRVGKDTACVLPRPRVQLNLRPEINPQVPRVLR